MLSRLKIPDFGRHVLKMATGTVLAQAIPILLSPVLTRLYTPEQYGACAFFLGASMVLGVVTTGRYELAIVLPKEDTEAASIFSGGLLISGMICLGMVLLTSLFGTELGRLVGHTQPGSWLPYLPLMIFFINLYQALNYWSNRNRQYGRIASSMVVWQIATVFISLALGVLKWGGNGLVIGRTLGQLSAAVFLFWQLSPVFRDLWKTVTWDGIRNALRKYRQFPLFNVPYSLVGSFSREFIVFALSTFNQVHATGQYALARTVVYVPAALVSASLGQVFFKEAAEHIGTPRVERLLIKLMTGIAIFAAPAFIFFMFWAQDIFALVFGANWTEAGTYAAVCAPAAYLFLFTSWPERIYEITNKQNVSFAIQIVADSISVVVLVGLLWLGVGPLKAIIAYMVISSGYHLVYLTAIFKVGGFHLENLWRLGRQVLSIWIGTLLLLTAVRFLIPWRGVQFGVGLALIVCYYVKSLLKALKQPTDAGYSGGTQT